MNGRELKQVVETCWQVANEADLLGVAPIVSEVCGVQTVNLIRWSIFNTLLATQTSHRNFETTYKLEDEKEPWQE